MTNIIDDKFQLKYKIKINQNLGAKKIKVIKNQIKIKRIRSKIKKITYTINFNLRKKLHQINTQELKK